MMMGQPVTASLVHHLVAGSHAEGTTRLAVAVVIEANQQILLIDEDSTESCDGYPQPPSDLVLPGETLTDAVHRTAAAVGITIDTLTGYLGHHDLPTDDTVVRTFTFAATTTSHPSRLTVRGTHRWAELDDLPDALNWDMFGLIHLTAPASAQHPRPR